jgi:hypothetical protein
MWICYVSNIYFIINIINQNNTRGAGHCPAEIILTMLLIFKFNIYGRTASCPTVILTICYNTR